MKNSDMMPSNPYLSYDDKRDSKKEGIRSDLWLIEMNGRNSSIWSLEMALRT
jgi:hypothetical protein